MKVCFAVAPYFRVLRSYNPRISLMLQTLTEIVGQKHEAVFVNGDAGTGPFADWMSIFLGWDRMRGEPMRLEVARFVEDIVRFDPDVVVLGLGDLYLPTVELHSAPTALEAARQLRLGGYHGRIVGVGTWPTMFKEAFQWPGFDAWVMGRCEGNILEIVESRARGALLGQAMPAELLPMVRTGKVWPKPDYATDYDYVLSSISCPFTCSFCLAPAATGAFSAMTPARFVDEVEYRLSLGATRLYFADMIFPLVAKRTRAIFEEMARRGIAVPWVCESRTEVSSDLLVDMKAAGCTHVKLGVEFLSDPSLSEMEKRQTSDKAMAAVQRVKDAGLNVVAYCMLGAVGSTEQDYWDALPLWQQLGASYYVINLSCPYYGTSLYRSMEPQLKAAGWHTPAENLWLSHFNTEQLALWGLSRDVLRAYLQLSRRTGKEDTGVRQYEAREDEDGEATARG